MKIDAFCHIVPPRYAAAVDKLTSKGALMRKYVEQVPTLYNWDQRFKIMEQYGEYAQILTISSFHLITEDPHSAEIAKIANDEVAELIAKYPEKFIGGVANLPTANPDDMLREAERAIGKLKLKGVELWASSHGKPVDSPVYMPLYQMMCEYDLPIWIHPIRGIDHPDFAGEKESKFYIFAVFGWPYETTVAMTHIVFSGIFEKYPTLKIITHHCGAMVPFFAGRIVCHYDLFGRNHKTNLKRHPIEYFRMFYNDTATNGIPSALMCGYEFFGPDKLVFATDMPMDIQMGSQSISETINAIDNMSIGALDKQKIYELNIRHLLHL